MNSWIPPILDCWIRMYSPVIVVSEFYALWIRIRFAHSANPELTFAKLRIQRILDLSFANLVYPGFAGFIWLRIQCRVSNPAGRKKNPWRMVAGSLDTKSDWWLGGWRLATSQNEVQQQSGWPPRALVAGGWQPAAGSG